MFREISKCFGINPLEEVISARRGKFLKWYCALDNLCHYIRCTLFVLVLLRFFDFVLICFSYHLYGEIKLYIIILSVLSQTL